MVKKKMMIPCIFLVCLILITACNNQGKPNEETEKSTESYTSFEAESYADDESESMRKILEEYVVRTQDLQLSENEKLLQSDYSEVHLEEELLGRYWPRFSGPVIDLLSDGTCIIGPVITPEMAPALGISVENLPDYPTTHGTWSLQENNQLLLKVTVTMDNQSFNKTIQIDVINPNVIVLRKDTLDDATRYAIFQWENDGLDCAFECTSHNTIS